eukprot:COSAG03_NODE_22928_length_285_cov_0.822581_1_plen_24_part_10
MVRVSCCLEPLYALGLRLWRLQTA